MERKVAIVGAGPGGLATAMLLARRGIKVDVYEAKATVGGRTQTWEQDGFRFDLGPTFFLYPRILTEIFEASGASLEEEVDLLQLDPQYRIAFEGRGNIDATPDAQKMEEQIDRLAPGEGKNFVRFMNDNRRKLEMARPVLERPVGSWMSMLAPSMLKAIPALRPWSVDKELSKYFSDPLVRIAFSFQSKYLGMSPYQCPSLFTILAFLEYEFGVHHPVGGFGTISDAMQRVAERNGASFFCDTAVTGLEFDGKKVTGVHSARGLESYDAVVVNGDFAKVIPSLVPDELRPRWNDKKIEKSRYSCSTFMLYLGIEGTEDLPHHTIHIPTTYGDALKAIEPLHELHPEPPFYIQNACVSDPGQAPEGHSTLYVLVPVSHQTTNIDWEAVAPSYREIVLDQLEAFGIKNLRSRIRTEKMITPADWESQHAVYRGAVFNLAHSLDQMLHLRPGNKFRGLEGLFLTGGGTHPGSGLPVIYESARISSQLLCDELGLAEKAPTATETSGRKEEPDAAA